MFKRDDVEFLAFCNRCLILDLSKHYVRIRIGDTLDRLQETAVLDPIPPEPQAFVDEISTRMEIYNNRFCKWGVFELLAHGRSGVVDSYPCMLTDGNVGDDDDMLPAVQGKRGKGGGGGADTSAMVNGFLGMAKLINANYIIEKNENAALRADNNRMSVELSAKYVKDELGIEAQRMQMMRDGFDLAKSMAPGVLEWLQSVAMQSAGATPEPQGPPDGTGVEPFIDMFMGQAMWLAENHPERMLALGPKFKAIYDTAIKFAKAKAQQKAKPGEKTKDGV